MFPPAKSTSSPLIDFEPVLMVFLHEGGFFFNSLIEVFLTAKVS